MTGHPDLGMESLFAMASKCYNRVEFLSPAGFPQSLFFLVKGYMKTGGPADPEVGPVDPVSVCSHLRSSGVQELNWADMCTLMGMP